MPSKLFSRNRRIAASGAISLLLVLSLIAAACGDDPGVGPTSTPTADQQTPTQPAESPTSTPPPGGGAITPTPEAGGADGFVAALRDLEAQIQRGGLDALVARLIIREYACTADDLTPHPGQPECATAGEVIRAFEMANWRSEGGLRKVDAVVAFLQRIDAGVLPAAADGWGGGEPVFYAFDTSVNRAVLTMMVECQENFGCTDEPQRLAMVLSFEFEDGRWKINRLMNAFVLYEDFLEPTAEGSGYFPEWEPMG